MLLIYKNLKSIDPFRPAFRPFFFAGPLYAAIAIFIWLLPIQNIVRVANPRHNVSWHVHEMLYGFVGAVVIGYLLTTISRAGSNKIIVSLLFLVWFMGRFVMNYFYSSWSPLALFTIDSLFPLAIASLVIKDLLIAGKKSHFLLVPVLFLFPTINILFHFGNTEAFKMSALLLLNHMIILMITIIGGRLIPSLTLSWLRSKKSHYLPESRSFIEVAVIITTVVTALIDVLFPDSIWLVFSASLAASFHLLRLWYWRSYKVFSNFSLLITHLAYAWIVTGYSVLAFCHFFDWVNHSTAMHILNIGTIGTMILVVMTRLSIRFQNKFVRITANITFVLILFATIFRLSGNLLSNNQTELLLMSGALWVMAFLTFLVNYSLSVYYISVFKKDRAN